MATAHEVTVRSDRFKAWTEGMAAYGRPELVLFELRADWAMLRTPRHVVLRDVLESASAAVVALDGIRIGDLLIRTPYGGFRFETTDFDVVELRLMDTGILGFDAHQG